MTSEEVYANWDPTGSFEDQRRESCPEQYGSQRSNEAYWCRVTSGGFEMTGKVHESLEETKSFRVAHVNEHQARLSLAESVQIRKELAQKKHLRVASIIKISRMEVFAWDRKNNCWKIEYLEKKLEIQSFVFSRRSIGRFERTRKKTTSRKRTN